MLVALFFFFLNHNNFPAALTATFHLQGFNLVYAVFFCDHTTSFEDRAHKFWVHEGGKNCPSPCPAAESNPWSLDYSPSLDH